MAKQYSVKKRYSINRKLVIAIVGVLIVIAFAGLFIYKKTHHKVATLEPTPATKIDLSPATPEEQQDSNQHKEDTLKEDTPATTPGADGQRTVSVVIVDASQVDSDVEVRSFVSNIIEDGGICKATFTKGSRSFTRQSTGVQDATTTRCGRIVAPVSDFTEKGMWNVTVQYNSSKATGVSSSAAFEVK